MKYNIASDHKWRVLLLSGLICLLNSGCATLLSGSTERVNIQAQPPEATILVLGGSAGSILAKSKKYGELTRKILDLTILPLSKDDQQILDIIGVEYFITAIIVEFKSGKLPDGTSASLVKFLAGIPAPIKKKLLDKFSIEDFGIGTLTSKLKRGRSYAVIGYQQGKLIQIEVIKTQFNWITLLNIFNLGIGVPFDIWTGAWQKLRPTKLDVTINKPMPFSP